MGSFLQKLNPMQHIDPLQQLAGKNSWFAKMDAYDPLTNSAAGKYINPQGYNLAQQYTNRNVVGSTPTPYAGVAPTLSAANNGYLQQSRNFTQQQQQQQSYF